MNIFFTEDDFRANEGGQVPVMVAKSSRIATRIVLEVVPLRVEQAINTIPLSLLVNIPENNTFSPPYAGNIICTNNLLQCAMCGCINSRFKGLQQYCDHDHL